MSGQSAAHLTRVKRADGRTVVCIGIGNVSEKYEIHTSKNIEYPVFFPSIEYRYPILFVSVTAQVIRYITVILPAIL